MRQGFHFLFGIPPEVLQYFPVLNLRSFISNLIDHIRASIQSLPVAHQWTGDGHLLQPVGILESQQLVGYATVRCEDVRGEGLVCLVGIAVLDGL
jgi:hypothetical protein